MPMFRSVILLREREDRDSFSVSLYSEFILVLHPSACQYLLIHNGKLVCLSETEIMSCPGSTSLCNNSVHTADYTHQPLNPLFSTYN